MTVNNTALSKTVEKIPLKKYLQTIDKLQKCSGLSDVPNVTSQGYRFISTTLVGEKAVVHTIIRAKGCKGGVENVGKCEACRKLDNALHNSVEIQKIHPNRPLNSVPRESLINEVKNIRSDNKQLKKLVESLKNQQEAVSVDEDVSEGLFSTLQSKSKDSGNQLMELFWEEQKKALASDPRGMRWHPMMIRFAIYLHFQSPRAYEALRETGVIRLPNKSTLRDYTNYVQPDTGFQTQAFEVILSLG